MKRAALLLLLLAGMPATADIGAGNWEMTVSTVVGGRPGATVTQVQCMKAEDARDPSRLFGSPGGGCSFSNRQDSGTVYRFEISCPGSVQLTGSGEMRYSRDAMDGDLQLRMKLEGQDTELRTTIKARRLGPCT